MNKHWFSLLVSLSVISSCSHKMRLIMDETSEPLYYYDYYCDENGKEGIVFYCSESEYSAKTLIVSADESECSWGPVGEIVMRSDSITDYYLNNDHSGLAVLQNMYYKGLEKYEAQDWCNKKNCGKVPYIGSWRLPTMNEWENICYRIRYLNEALKDIGGTTFDDNAYYWTATEDFIVKMEGDTTNTNDPYNRAIPMTTEQKMSLDKNKWIKENRHRVRAVKCIRYGT